MRVQSNITELNWHGLVFVELTIEQTVTHYSRSRLTPSVIRDASTNDQWRALLVDWSVGQQEIWPNAHETRESLWQFLFAGNLSLSSSISSQFTLLQPKIAKKSHKINTFRVQGYSRSSMLTFLRSSSSVFVMISSMSVPICNHFYVGRANSGRITSF